jgi:hypothetical protein
MRSPVGDLAVRFIALLNHRARPDQHRPGLTAVQDLQDVTVGDMVGFSL